MPTTSTTGYTLIKATTPVVQWTPLWHIILVSVAAGCGLALAFGFILLGVEGVQVAKTSAMKIGGYGLGLVATLFCLAAIGLGVYAMVNPSKSKPLKVVPSSSPSALVATPHGTNG